MNVLVKSELKNLDIFCVTKYNGLSDHMKRYVLIDRQALSDRTFSNRLEMTSTSHVGLYFQLILWENSAHSSPSKKSYYPISSFTTLP